MLHYATITNTTLPYILLPYTSFHLAPEAIIPHLFVAGPPSFAALGNELTATVYSGSTVSCLVSRVG